VEEQQATAIASVTAIEQAKNGLSPDVSSLSGGPPEVSGHPTIGYHGISAYAVGYGAAGCAFGDRGTGNSPGMGSNGGQRPPTEERVPWSSGGVAGRIQE